MPSSPYPALSPPRLTFTEMYEFVFDYFGARCSGRSIDSGKQQLSCLLYESYELVCGIDNQYGTFHAAVVIGETQATSKFFNRNVSPNPDRQSVVQGLGVIDEWCRLRLPPIFLEGFEHGLVTPPKKPGFFSTDY